MQGVKTVTKRAGDGKTFPKKGQTVTVHYIGQLMNGTQFDASIGKKPFSFLIGMGQVIRGWDEGVSRMSLGEIALLQIAPEYGYGSRGAGADIPPNSTLMFQVELLAIN
jgi:FKBP-type peptidyl-prolyl cis-trans isomerase